MKDYKLKRRNLHASHTLGNLWVGRNVTNEEANVFFSKFFKNARPRAAPVSQAR